VLKPIKFVYKPNEMQKIIDFFHLENVNEIKHKATELKSHMSV
jgi:hypothetical protein